MQDGRSPARFQGALALDGSHGEGGGQVLRTALALAVALGRPVTIDRIRLRRPRPGLQPQHLAVVRALAAISEATVVGDELDSTAVAFTPRTLRSHHGRFDVGAVRGSAGSVTLLFQALLLPLILANGPSHLALVGGTHVPWSPPVPYLDDVFLPALRTLGIEARITLSRWGWYPAGGGEIEAAIVPGRPVRGLSPARWPPLTVRGLSAVSRLPRSIAERQQRRAAGRLEQAGLPADIGVEVDTTARSPGTVLFLAVPGRAGASALGRRGLPAEKVADTASEALLVWVASGTDLDEHLADQIVPFLALAGVPSSFTCPRVSRHLETVAWVVEQFLSVDVSLEVGPPARISVRPRPEA